MDKKLKSFLRRIREDAEDTIGDCAIFFMRSKSSATFSADGVRFETARRAADREGFLITCGIEYGDEFEAWATAEAAPREGSELEDISSAIEEALKMALADFEDELQAAYGSESS